MNPPDSAFGLWYNPKLNRFFNESGDVMHDLSPYFNTWILDQWKRRKRYALLTDKKGDLWELYYERCTRHCLYCEIRCDIYYMVKD